MLNSDDLKKKKKHAVGQSMLVNTAQGENKALYVLLFCFKEKEKSITF